MKKIYWDLDGVLRDLYKVTFANRPTHWGYTENGLDIFDVIKKDYTLLEKAPPTPFYKIAIKQPFLNILTHQPNNWIPYTENWINKHFSSIYCKIIYVGTRNQKIDIINKENAYLIEDCPLFDDYSRIILIDSPHNKNIKVKYRIKTPKQLEELLNLINKDLL